MDYFKKARIRTLNWPARSPDLSPIENVWKMMEDIIYKDEQPENVSQLATKVEGAKNALRTHERNKLKICFPA